MKGTIRGTATDPDGYFSLRVSQEERKLPLLFQTIGYVSQELPQPTKVKAQGLLVALDVDVKGGLVWYAPIYTPQGVWQRVSSIPRRILYAVRRDY
ncbi:carboxypeptidase-like regulatory domain-containing protein [Hymenobacter cellulosilyticus]|uniref:Carboxypeptidase-like regulatory domain-containing protein n=1 Tax=Hymenobacter cellulosilyticus TaxID=2932248 RepID=A0A8T9Q8D9_9BACT|nr:carboxypeptidase-like regulatory domain-containing protein [Hymenobacter cellulosilyticus]